MSSGEGSNIIEPSALAASYILTMTLSFTLWTIGGWVSWSSSSRSFLVFENQKVYKALSFGFAALLSHSERLLGVFLVSQLCFKCQKRSAFVSPRYLYMYSTGRAQRKGYFHLVGVTKSQGVNSQKMDRLQAFCLLCCLDFDDKGLIEYPCLLNNYLWYWYLEQNYNPEKREGGTNMPFW